MVPVSAHPSRHRSAADRQSARRHDPPGDPLAGAGVLARRRHPVLAQHRGARAGRRALARRRSRWRPELPLWVSVDQEGGRVARLEGAVHRVAADGRRSDAAATPTLAGTVRRGAGGGAEGGRHHARLRAGARHPHQPEEPGDRRSRARRDGRRRWPASAPPSSAGCRTTAWPRAASTFPGMATPRSTRTSSCRSSSIRRIGIRRVECVPFREAIRADVAFIMTAHVLVPSLDEEQPATLSPRDRAGDAARRARLSAASSSATTSR